MWRDRPLLRPHVAAYAKVLAQAQADLHALHLQHQCAVADLRREVNELRDIIGDVVSAFRQKADQDVGQLRRQLEIALVRLTQRDPAKPVH
jgi:hypothetical protein